MKKLSSFSPIQIVSKREIQQKIHENNVKKYLKRYMKMDLSIEEKEINTKYEDMIWICWFQGIHNAPDIVKRCAESIKENSSGRKVINIDLNNLNDYIEFPNYIIEKWKSGNISNAHFSDLIRVSLLSNYGGTWIDATVYLTEPLPEYIFENNLFFFQQSLLDFSPIRGSSWLINSKPNHVIIEAVKESLYEYWKKEDYLIDYFTFHLIWSLALESFYEKTGEEIKIPYYPNVTPHILQFELFNDFSETRWNQIIKTTSVHKLSWKLDQKEKEKRNTFYRAIIEDSELI